MTHYITTAAGTLEEAISKAAEALAFAAEDWLELTGDDFPPPRTIDQLRTIPEFVDEAADAIVAAIPFEARFGAAAE